MSPITQKHGLAIQRNGTLLVLGTLVGVESRNCQKYGACNSQPGLTLLTQNYILPKHGDEDPQRQIEYPKARKH